MIALGMRTRAIEMNDREWECFYTLRVDDVSVS